MTPDALSEALRAVAPFTASAARVLVGICGPPGAGKSTLATALATALCAQAGEDVAVAVPMDGFHLANAELRRLGLADRKGAPETFDGAGFAHLLGRIRADSGETVYAPAYSRILHESIGGAIPVTPEARIVVIEGNYLLLDSGPWAGIRTLLDLAIYLDAPERTRTTALLRRQRARGLTEAAARDWVFRSDEANAALIAATRERADIVLTRS
jgi:pantothenate kinase